MTHANQTRSQVLEAPWDSAVSSGPGWRDASLHVPNLTWRGAWPVCATTFFSSAPPIFPHNCTVAFFIVLPQNLPNIGVLLLHAA